jgi:hypothetical protein
MIWAIVLGALVVAVAGLLVVASTRPSEFHVERSGTIAAPPEVIFPLVNDFHNWEQWSPWAKLDPNCKIAFEGAPSGVSAVQRWDGDKRAGAGSCTIIESKPSSLIRIRLDFLRPFKATNIAEFNFQPQGDQTRVVWSMSGKNNLMGKVFSMFVNCDDMIGKDFEKGLAAMKTVAEGAALPAMAGA